MKTIESIYDLVPSDSHKSFYGKAKVKCYTDGSKTLMSYNTAICTCLTNGAIIRHWGGWSATTGRHIAAFCGLNKKQFCDIPVYNNMNDYPNRKSIEQ